jgi:D-aspartate ligase
VVIGGELNGLGVCRSLALGGVPTRVIDRKRFNPALWSRSARPLVVDTLTGDGIIEILQAYGERMEEPPFLVVTDEPALLTISEQRQRLEGLYRFRLPAHDVVMMLHDKARFHENAVRRGWPVPSAVVVRDRADLAAIGSLRPPLIVKPADKLHFHQGHTPRLTVARGRDEAVLAADAIRLRAGTVLVQETIEGPDENIYFCLFYRGRAGETLGMFTGRKLASTPPGVGSTAFCTAADGRELERVTEEILDQVGYFGFGGIEYKRDARDGRFLIIEPTVGRTDWQEEIATLTGVNIPLIAYRHETGQAPLPAPPIDQRVVWQFSWIERLRYGSKAIPPGSVVVDGFFRRNDPLPAVVHYPVSLATSASRLLLRSLPRPSLEGVGVGINWVRSTLSSKAKI